MRWANRLPEDEHIPALTAFLANGKGLAKGDRRSVGVSQRPDPSKLSEDLVELVGIEPTTSSLRTMRSPS